MPKANMKLNYEEMLNFHLKQWDEATQKMREFLSNPDMSNDLYKDFCNDKERFDWTMERIWKLKSLILETQQEMAATSTTTQEPVN